jgi:hypothetical protein
MLIIGVNISFYRVNNLNKINIFLNNFLMIILL